MAGQLVIITTDLLSLLKPVPTADLFSLPKPVPTTDFFSFLYLLSSLQYPLRL
jgi:hypothetical protein